VQLQQELGNISEKQAYDKAVEGSPSYAELQFLKAESWDGRKAAQRVVQFYEEQERLFGLARGVLRQSDLSHKENDCLGRVACLLEEPDKAGRRVVFTRLDELFTHEKLSVVGSSKILESVLLVQLVSTCLFSPILLFVPTSTEPFGTILLELLERPTCRS
jgi:hypothetical protein